jgi:hypothetical protein
MSEPAMYDPAADPDTRFDTAIARRNVAWAEWQAALQLQQAAARVEHPDLRAYTANANRFQHDYEWAARELVRERGRWRASRRAA